MCGITGIFNFERDKIVDKSLLKRMTDKLSHRGPDGDGYYLNQNIGLGHRRLSIIDLQSGDQPMVNESKSVSLVLNGEIFNYIELRDELRKLGHQFRTNSDTEVVIKSYEQWGIDCQNKFNGMWAFALWDDVKQQLFLSRDRIGEKPLNYCMQENTLIFSSEIKSLFEYGVPRETRLELIEIYMVMTNVPGPDTFYKNIFKLRPGHYILANSHGFREIKYWDMPEIDERNMLSDKFAIYDEFAYLLEDSVKIRMRSDVPYGAFLSGGLDSSSIVMLMSKVSSLPVETFTIGFPQKDFNETKLAKLVADNFKTNHHTATVNPFTLEEAIRMAVLHFDEPFGDSSAIPTNCISKFAVKKVKMVLTGDGGDEVLSGYNAYAGLKFSDIYTKTPNLIQNSLLKGARLISIPFTGAKRYRLNRIVSVLETATLPFMERVANKSSYIPLPIIKMLTANIQNKISIEDYLSNLVNNIPYHNDFYRLMYLNFKYNLPDDYLVKVDRMSMANSLETRAPFLDYRLIEFMVRVDKKIKMHGFERKSILRNTLGKSLPKQLLKATKKGFGIPLREWFKEKNNNDLFKLGNVRSICDSRTVQKIIEDNRNGTGDYGNFLWTIILLDKFLY